MKYCWGFVIAAAVVLSGCTTIHVKTTDEIISDDQAFITLINEQKIQAHGFSMKNGELKMMVDGTEKSIPVEKVDQIENVDRVSLAKTGAIGGSVGVGAFGAYALATAGVAEQGLLILLVPLGMLMYGLIGGAAGYLIGERTYYEFNHMNLAAKSEYSESVDRVELVDVNIVSIVEARK